MQIIIPMTGYGSRFVAAGYKDLKPFIRIYNRPIIQWIIEGMYPGENNIIFICRDEHLRNMVDMEEKLLSFAPASKIFAISNWVKKGPVYDVLRASDVIDDDEAAIINYCDFYMVWDWYKMRQRLLDSSCDGAIPCYTGFHPHLMVKDNYYASCLTDDEDNLIEIREKFSYEKDKTRAKHSPGVYYFKSGKLLKKYCRLLVDSGQMVNGEYYASMPYNFMVKDGLKVWIPTNIEYFCQWGTPEDMAESLFWLNTIKRIIE